MLVEAHERPLRAFLSRQFGEDDADDIAQDAFLKAWRRSASFDGRARYATWLTRIAWNCAIDRRRARRDWPVDTPPEARSVAPSEAGAEVGRLLSALTPQERASLILCEGHGWTHGEAAELLAMPLGTLKSTVARAKARCRATISGGTND